MSGAEVKGDRRVMQAVTPRFLSLCARNWIRRGEDIHVIDVRDDRVQLLPAGSWDVNGGPDPDSWWYRLELYSPGKIENAVLPRAGVVHSVWAVASEEPYRGQAPWEFANLSASVLSNLERRLAEEAGGPVGHLLPIPADGGDGEADDPLTGLKASLGDLSGELAVVETTSAGVGRGTYGSASPGLAASPDRRGPAGRAPESPWRRGNKHPGGLRHPGRARTRPGRHGQP